MPSCYPNCDLRDLLRAKEDKVSKLQQMMRWCEDLYQSEPHRHREVFAKKSIVYNMINQTQWFDLPNSARVRDMPRPLSHKKKQSQTVTLSKETDTRPTTQPAVPNEVGLKSEDKCKLNDALKLMLSLPPSTLSGQLFTIFFWPYK